MFRNCNKCFCSRPGAFVRITNYTSLIIYFVLEYNCEQGLISKESPKFQRDQYQQISLIKSAKDIKFYVISAPSVIHTIICKRELSKPSYYYFNVVETPTGPICVEK